MNIDSNGSKYIFDVLQSCVLEEQVYAWFNWVDRILKGKALELRYLHDIGQAKLDSLLKEVG